jgi:hypothetical protein
MYNILRVYTLYITLLTYTVLAPVMSHSILIEQPRLLCFQLSANFLCVSEREHLVNVSTLSVSVFNLEICRLDELDGASRVSASASGITPVSLAAAAVMDLTVEKLEGSGRLSKRTDSDWYSSSASVDILDMNFCNTTCASGISNPLHHVGLARCPFLSHERAEREGDRCHEKNKR